MALEKALIAADMANPFNTAADKGAEIEAAIRAYLEAAGTEAWGWKNMETGKLDKDTCIYEDVARKVCVKGETVVPVLIIEAGGKP